MMPRSSVRLLRAFLYSILIWLATSSLGHEATAQQRVCIDFDNGLACAVATYTPWNASTEALALVDELCAVAGVVAAKAMIGDGSLEAQLSQADDLWVPPVSSRGVTWTRGKQTVPSLVSVCNGQGRDTMLKHATTIVVRGNFEPPSEHAPRGLDHERTHDGLAIDERSESHKPSLFGQALQALLGERESVSFVQVINAV